MSKNRKKSLEMTIPKSSKGSNFKELIELAKNMWPLLPAAAYLLGFLIIVLVYLIGMSFSHIECNEVVFPSLHQVKVLFKNPEFLKAFYNSAVFVVVGTPLELISGLAVALLVYKSCRLRGIIRSIFILPVAVPALVTAILLFILFDYPGGHINHLLEGKYSIFPAVIDYPLNWRASKFFSLGIAMFGKIWRDMPISMLILLSGLNTIEPDYIDAAKTMGAGIYKRTRYIMVPLILPAVSAVVLLRSIEMWKEFIFPFVLAGRYNLLGTFIESLYKDWGYSHQAALVAIVLVLCIIVSALVFSWMINAFKRLLIY